jgi:hypothetical protein
MQWSDKKLGSHVSQEAGQMYIHIFFYVDCVTYLIFFFSIINHSIRDVNNDERYPIQKNS